MVRARARVRARVRVRTRSGFEERFTYALTLNP